MLLIGYGGDVPPSGGCGEPPTNPADIDRYRSGAGGVIVAAEVLVLGAYAVAVRRCAGRKSRVLEASLALTAAGVGAIGATWILTTRVDWNALEVFGGVAIAALAWLGLRVVARRPPTLVAATLALALAVPLALTGWILAFFAYLGPALVLVPAGIDRGQPGHVVLVRLDVQRAHELLRFTPQSPALSESREK